MEASDSLLQGTSKAEPAVPPTPKGQSSVPPAPPGEVGTFETSDGWALSHESWPALAINHQADTKGEEEDEGEKGKDEGESDTRIALFLHGVNASADTVQCRRLAAAFRMRGVTFHALEHHAHGNSVRKKGRKKWKGLIEGFTVLVGHCVEFASYLVQQAKRDGRRVRLYLIGHSMGGATAVCSAAPLRDALGEAFGGLVLIAPSIKLKKPPARCVTSLMWVLSWVGLGMLPLGPKDDTTGYTPATSRPQGIGRNYAGGMRIGTASALVLFAERFEEEFAAGDITLPGGLVVLLVTGEQDETVDVVGVQDRKSVV